MSKKYKLPEEEPMMAKEPVGAYAYITEARDSVLEFWKSDDAPCQYSLDELTEILKQGEENIANGRVIKHEDVQQMMLNKIASKGSTSHPNYI